MRDCITIDYPRGDYSMSTKHHRLVRIWLAFLVSVCLLCGLQVGAWAATAQVGAGLEHNLALKTDGSVWTWGRNYYGQLGHGSTVDGWYPYAISSLSSVVSISGGDTHSLAAKSDGTVWAWGNNGSGRLGDGTTTNRSSPVQVSGLTNAAAVAAGGSHSLALKSDGTVWAWGLNSNGQLV